MSFESRGKKNHIRVLAASCRLPRDHGFAFSVVPCSACCQQCPLLLTKLEARRRQWPGSNCESCVRREFDMDSCREEYGVTASDWKMSDVKEVSGHDERWRFKESTSGFDHRGRAFAQQTLPPLTLLWIRQCFWRSSNGHSHLWGARNPEFFGHRLQNSMTSATVEDRTAGLGQTLRTGRPLFGG